MSPDTPPLARYNCPRRTGPIRIDGTLDERDWQRAPLAELNECTAGTPLPPELRTRARMLWDDEHLYVAFDVADPDIRCTLTERDDCLFEEDVVELFVQMRGATEVQAHFAELEISPTGVLMDVYNVAPYKSLINWDAKGWRCATVIDGTPNKPHLRDRGYKVEMAIPFINFCAQPLLPQRARQRGASNAAPKPGEQWRLNLFRIDHSGEPDVATYCAWSPTVELMFHTPHRFGIVTFVE